MLRLIELASVLLVFSPLCHAQPVIVHGAEPNLVNGVVKVSFEPFVVLDWKRKAKAALKWLNVDAPTNDQIAILKKKLTDPDDPSVNTDTPQVAFSLPLETAAARGTFFFAGIDGVFALKPLDLMGLASYQLDEAHQKVIGTTFSGDIDGITPGHNLDQYRGGGFVLFSRRPARASQMTPAPASLLARVPEHKGIPIEAAYTFRFAGATYLFVKWEIYHDSICGFEACLYKVGEQLGDAVGVAYGCDNA